MKTNSGSRQMKKHSGDRSYLFIVLFVFLAAVMGLVYMNLKSSFLSGAVVLVPSQPGDSVIIAGINLNENIGVDVPVLTKSRLKTLEGGVVRTKKSASYQQVLRLTSNEFTGGKLAYTRDSADDLGDFLYFDVSEPLFELEWVFSPALTGSIDSNNRIDGLNSEALNVLGKDYLFVDSEVSGNSVALELVGDVGNLRFEDSDITDDDFSADVEINSRNVMADVKIKGFASSSQVTLTSIRYRPKSKSKSYFGDVYVPPNRGARSFLRDPQVLLSNSFDIVYGGFLGSPTATASLSADSEVLHFSPSGDRYKLIFTNIRGRTYSVPLVENSGGSLVFGTGSHDFIVREGSSTSDYNINENDYFMVTSSEDINGVSSILKYNGIEYIGGRVFISDLAGGSITVNFDKLTNKGVMVVGGYSYDVYVSPSSPHPITVDVNKDGAINSGEAKLVFLGGAWLDFGVQGDILTIDMIVPGRLFQKGGAGETNTIRISSPGDKVDITVASPKLIKDKSGFEKSISDFGISFVHDSSEPGDLKVYFPKSAKAHASAIGRTAAESQIAGVVLITTNREKFLKNHKGSEGRA